MSMLVFLLILAVVAFALAMDGSQPDLSWRQWHHAYLGWLLGITALPLTSESLLIIALVVAWDDALQHGAQSILQTSQRLSILAAIWYATAGRLVHLLIGRWADRRLGRRQ